LSSTFTLLPSRHLNPTYMTIDILSIPVISDKSERIFSKARRTIS
jgi:hypothetical protein